MNKHTCTGRLLFALGVLALVCDCAPIESISPLPTVMPIGGDGAEADMAGLIQTDPNDITRAIGRKGDNRHRGSKCMVAVAAAD